MEILINDDCYPHRISSRQRSLMHIIWVLLGQEDLDRSQVAPGSVPPDLVAVVVCRVAVAAQSTHQITRNILALPRGPASSPTLSPSDETGAL